MKRDMDLVRDILLFFEQRETQRTISADDIIEGKEVQIAGYDGRLISDHVDIMAEAGLLEGVAENNSSGMMIQFHPSRLTWEGHEFLAAARNKGVWEKFKNRANETGLNLPFSVVKSLLTRILEQEVGLAS